MIRPTHLDTTTKSYFVSVSIDKLEAKYTGGQGIHEHDIGFVRSNASVPTERSVFYYEIEVKNAGLRRSITMGFTSKTTKLDKTMNWFEGLFGYRSKDGFKLRDGPKGESYGPTFTSTDIVGAGVDFQLMEIFFTKNGKHVGFAFQNVPGFLYPTIGLHSPGEHVSVNFGQKPFLFDIQKYVVFEREAQEFQSNHFPHVITRISLLTLISIKSLTHSKRKSLEHQRSNGTKYLSRASRSNTGTFRNERAK